VAIRLERDETIVGVCCGGGGYGLPVDRDPARVAHDVGEGYVTRARAESVYGVVPDAAGAVNFKATEKRRASSLSHTGEGSVTPWRKRSRGAPGGGRIPSPAG
jgi:hypothetical protein